MYKVGRIIPARLRSPQNTHITSDIPVLDKTTSLAIRLLFSNTAKQWPSASYRTAFLALTIGHQRQ